MGPWGHGDPIHAPDEFAHGIAMAAREPAQAGGARSAPPRAGDAHICIGLGPRVLFGLGRAFSALAAVTHSLGQVSSPESG